MRLLVDALIMLAAVLLSPWWLMRMARRGKLRTDWPGRFGSGPKPPHIARPGGGRILVHAVSVGEINAIRELVDQLEQRPDPPQIVISVTTDTGIQRATSLFGDRLTVVRYPFDFNFAVRRFLDRVRPDLVVLVELEVWPNFVRICRERGAPIMVINGRLTERSLKQYRKVRRFIRPAFASLDAVATQSETYAERFKLLGVPNERLSVTGTMKWDTARIEDEVDGSAALAESMGIDRRRPLVVAGSTAPDEHRLLHEATPAGVQLLCAPRKPEWFDAAAEDLPGCVRRSTGGGDRRSDRFLLDTIGELRQAYALADVVVIGRSFGNLHGSDMMEPAALGKAVVVGPAVDDFQETVDALIEGEGIIQTDRAGLASVLERLLSDEQARQRLASNARRVIREQQGASERHREMIALMLDSAPRQRTKEG